MIAQRLKELNEKTGIDFFLSNQIIKGKKEYWEKWTPYSKWDWKIIPNARQVLPSEIIIETDENKEKNFELTLEFERELISKEIAYEIWFTGNKSYHIHLFIKELNKLNEEQRTQAKKHIAKLLTKENYKYVDTANFNPKRLIRIEGSTHPKTKQQGKLISKNYEHNYKMPKLVFTKNKEIKTNNTSVNKCLLLNKALEQSFEEGYRNRILTPNAVAVLNETELETFCEKQERSIAEIKGWQRKKPKFDCEQMQWYAKRIGLFEETCEKCLLNKLYLKGDLE